MSSIQTANRNLWTFPLVFVTVSAGRFGNPGLILYRMNAVCESLSLVPAGWWVIGLCETLLFPWKKRWMC